MKTKNVKIIIGLFILITFKPFMLRAASPDTGSVLIGGASYNKDVYLHIAGGKPSLEVDSAREIPSNELKYVWVFDTTGKILAKISLDSLKKKIIPAPEAPQMFSSGYYSCAANSYPDPFMSFYTDSTNRANSSQGYICIQSQNGGCQIRRLRDDWSTSGSYNFIQYGSSIAFIGNYVYVLCFQMDYSSYSNYTPRVYRYNKEDLAAGGTLITFIGLSLSVSTGPFVMAYSDNNFFFSYNGGNSVNSNVIAKYSLSGITLNYVSSTTYGVSTDFRGSFLVDSDQNVFTSTDVPTIKTILFSSTGTLIKETPSGINYFMNWNNNFYGLRFTSISPVPFLFYEKINK